MPLYFAYGLRIFSVIALPFPFYSNDEREVDLRIDYAHVPEFTGQQTRYGTKYAYKENTITITNPTFGSFIVRGGSEVYVDVTVRHPGEQLLEVAITGLVLALALQQRGLYVLHGSAVSREGKGIAFLGNKGVGKSTLSAFLVENGFDLLADDTVAVIQTENRNFNIQPSFPQMKLWPDALSFLNREPGQYPTITPSVEKRLIPAQNRFDNQPTPLSAVFILGIDIKLEIKRLAASRAFEQLAVHKTGSFFCHGAPTHFQEQQFSLCSTLSKTTPVYTLNRPRDLQRLPDTQKLIECVL